MRKLGKIGFAFALAATLVADTQSANAQVIGNQVYEPGTFRQVAADINLGLPGRLWVRSTYADQGLGFQGSYLTLGGKRRLFQDSWDGRWLGEGRFHYSLEEGGFFANLGVERVYSIKAAGADLVCGFWYDYDDDRQGNFANTFNQVGVNAAVKTKKFDIIGNGYFPVGTTDFSTELEPGNVFLGNNILLRPGIDSALQGFDVTLRMRPKFLAFGNGSVDFGGYGYSSDSIDYFGGGRVRTSFQSRNGMTLTAEVNQDDRFDTTGLLSLAWNFGAAGTAFGGAGVGLGNDLAETVRNDHIVRFNQEFELAIDPETGAAYNVVHVDSDSNDDGTGTVDNPFATLAEAELASGEGDIIFLSNGSLDLDTGIVLQDRQQLFGAGVDHLLPIQNGEFFQINSTGPSPTISNPGGAAVVELANDNVVRGVIIDGTGAGEGILGDSVSGGLIDQTTVDGALASGLRVQNFTGDWTVTNSTFNGNSVDGIFFVNGDDNQSVITFAGNTASNNGFDGIHVESFRGTQLALDGNTSNSNGRHGLFVEQFIGEGLDFDLFSHTANDNSTNGILITQGDGDLDIRDITATGNSFNGLEIINFTNSLEGDSTRISATEGTISNLGGNQNNNLAITLDNPNLTQDVLVTGLTMTGGGQRGLVASATGANSELTVAVVNNTEFSQHISDGLRFEVDNSATLNVLVENDDPDAPLILNDNAQASGAGLAFFADGDIGQPSSLLNAVVRNVSINNDLESGFTSSVVSNGASDGVNISGSGTSRINLELEDSRIESSGGFDIAFDNDGQGDVNNVFLSDLTVRANNPVIINTAPGTLLDFSLASSDLQSNGLVRSIADGGTVDDPDESGDPFTDLTGNVGFTANLNGGAAADLDNFTRIQITDTVIRDFTNEAINITTTGDAQLLATINSNEILSNGPGQDDGIEFPDDPDTGNQGPAVAPDQLFFANGININALDNSLISLRMNSNSIFNNFEQGLQLNTSGTATINASLNFNTFANDVGQDADATDAGVSTSFETDFSANNSVFGTMCLTLEGNTFGSDALFNQASANVFRVELDGATNGFTTADLPVGITTGSVGICEGLIEAEELFFAATGAVDDDTPQGGGFSSLEHN